MNAIGKFIPKLGAECRLKDLLANGSAKLEGDKTAFGKIMSTLVQFDANFEIVPLPPTAK
ncbi:alkyl sulfatase C-terminal domain-containing protein [Shewanella xiamenensis]|uniref:Alkyl sulfatase C-terminal domain-containing protein n=1 Tax=Shewanella xiamenensis TaxID=332186 RepID=A0AAE4TJR9_9GAMM|nr:alkyl sulfatase C-terminal domain-containing protein [Shewanella xiamenensis]MDV5389557.1 alkyl sulfatase C-terminal domain-containing protein [Shewanella xiamenensis]